MVKTTILFSLGSLLMAAIFGYSASVQLNDPHWYFWFPLCACVCAVNLLNCAISKSTTIRQIAKVTLWFGIFLFLKVVVEDFVTGTAGFLSLDLSERVVREKTGRGLVVISLILHLEASSYSSQPKHLTPSPGKKKEFRRYVAYGMAVLVSISCGLVFVFILFGEVEFDHIKKQNLK